MKVFIVIASCFGLFIIHSFKSAYNDIARTSNYSREIISCGSANQGSITKFTPYDFTPGGDLMEKISVNDNRKPAGELRGGVLYLNLEARLGNWYPETEEGKPLQVYAFAEAGKPLQLPGPLIRVPEGTLIKTQIRNLIPGDPLILHGFYSRPALVPDSIIIPYDSTVDIPFRTGRAGNYFYWASHGNLKIPGNGLPYFTDSQLYGAFIIDPPETKPDPLERIIMIGIWNDTLNGQYGEELVLNGLTWPYTERLTYEKDQLVKWRIINASNQEHPVHLHGFFFTIKGHGNADWDTSFNSKRERLAVTELLAPHETMAITWNANREGNWLVHCHTLVHMLAGSFLRKIPEMNEQEMNDINNHARDGMGGLIMGISVFSKKETALPGAIPGERQLTLIIREKKNWYDTLTGYSFVLREGNHSSDTTGSIPGPPIILEKGKPVAIKIINQLHENTTIHWHGLEIESYFDGVAGWGNNGKKLAPMIMPGDSFVAHLVPHRAGTYMYHTHMHNLQLMQGMYGALIVTEPNQKFNSTTNKIFVISQGGYDFDNRLLFINGKVKSGPMDLKAGTHYRFRIINITALGPDLTASVTFNGVPVTWHSLAKDGADLQPSLQVNQPARSEPVTIGETKDFAFKPGKPGEYLFEVRDYKNDIVVSKKLNVL
jgi:FtsP/CotA-like multicopper oxidase with cupredoxin domain